MSTEHCPDFTIFRIQLANLWLFGRYEGMNAAALLHRLVIKWSKGPHLFLVSTYISSDFHNVSDVKSHPELTAHSKLSNHRSVNFLVADVITCTALTMLHTLSSIVAHLSSYRPTSLLASIAVSFFHLTSHKTNWQCTGIKTRHEYSIGLHGPSSFNTGARGPHIIISWP